MAYLVELNIKENGNAILINTGAIAFVENDEGQT